MNDSLTIRDTIYEVSKFLKIAKKDIWNANRIRNKYVSDIPIEDNQFLLFDSFSDEYQMTDYAKNAGELTFGTYNIGQDLDDINQIDNLPNLYRTLNITDTKNRITSPNDVNNRYVVSLYPDDNPKPGIEHVILNSTGKFIEIDYTGTGNSPPFTLELDPGDGTRIVFFGTNNVSWKTI